MKKILFVCLGNICRSPLAHGIAQKISNHENLGYEIDSAGTSDWHVGETPCEHSIAVAKRHNVNITSQHSRIIQKEDIMHYTYVVAMDRQNKKDMEAFGFKDVYLLGNFAGYNGKDVPDPYFLTGNHVEDGFEKVYTMIEKCVKDFMLKVENGSL